MTIEELAKLRIQDMLHPHRSKETLNKLVSLGWVTNSGQSLYYKYDDRTGRPFLTTDSR